MLTPVRPVGVPSQAPVKLLQRPGTAVDKHRHRSHPEKFRYAVGVFGAAGSGPQIATGEQREGAGQQPGSYDEQPGDVGPVGTLG